MSSKSTMMPVGFDARDAHLTLDGHDLVALGREHGTPLFVFSERQLRHNASSFLAGARAGHEKARIFYASKACSNRRVLEIFHSASDESARYHVAHLRVNATPHDDGFKVRLGRAYGENDIIGGRRWKMTAAQFTEFRAFIARAIAARDS